MDKRVPHVQRILLELEQSIGELPVALVPWTKRAGYKKAVEDVLDHIRATRTDAEGIAFLIEETAGTKTEGPGPASFGNQARGPVPPRPNVRAKVMRLPRR